MTTRAPTRVDQALADLFSGRVPLGDTRGSPLPATAARRPAFSFLFFSDVRKEVSDQDKYAFTRKLVEFADASGFEAVYFPERHFSEFGSIYADNGVMAAYFAPLTSRVRLRTAAITNTLHHPAAIVESWAMIDILSGGRVDLGFGSGWNKRDFVLSPDTYHDRNALRDERIPVIQRLWRGETVSFPGPDGELHPTRVYPRPLQPELTVWYVTTSTRGFEFAGQQGWNVFTMLSGVDLSELRKKITAYRKARQEAGLEPSGGTVSLMMHTLVHPDPEWVERQVSEPFKDYIRSSLGPHMEAMGKVVDPGEVDKMVAYSYARYYQTGGIFGSVSDCEKQVRKAARAGVDEIVFLQDFGIDYAAVLGSLEHLEELVRRCWSWERAHG
jgi:natural product biosynthesis luciferase-like monooxygenase protein